MPFGFGRRKTAPQQGVADGTDALPLTDPVGGVGEYARSAGWTGPLTDPGLDQSALQFAHDMLKHLYGVPDSVTFTPVGGGPNRYADAFAGQLDGHDFVFTNVSFTVSHLHGGEQPLLGSLCAMEIGAVIPLVLVQPSKCEPFMRAMTKEVKIGRPDFDDRFRVRSGHPDYAVELITPLTDELLRRDDWAFFVEFANLICVTPEPFRTVADITERLESMQRLTHLIPAAVLEAYAVKTITTPSPDAASLSDADRDRAKQIIDSMPRAQRQELIARMRTEGPETVIREVLDNP